MAAYCNVLVSASINLVVVVYYPGSTIVPCRGRSASDPSRVATLAFFIHFFLFFLSSGVAVHLSF